MNTNCLGGLRCPKCGSWEPFYVDVRVTVLVWDDGGENTYDDQEWDDDSAIHC